MHSRDRWAATQRKHGYMKYYARPKRDSRTHKPLFNFRGGFKIMHTYLRGITHKTANSPQSTSMRTVPNAITHESPEGTSWLPQLLHPPSPGSCRYRHSWTLCLLLRRLRHPRPQSPICWPTSLAYLLPITGSTCD